MEPVAALAVPSPGEAFEAVTYGPRSLRPDDVRIDVAFAGICHSDIHVVREEWHEGIFPMVPGHEIAGTVSEVGPGVTRHRVGDRVGVGCMVDSCATCEFCLSGQEMFCQNGYVATYNARGYDGVPTRGGYAKQVTVSERFVVTIPDALGLDVAAPLLCAGITTWEPLNRWGAAPGRRVAVVGLGGLGHVAVKIAVAMGAEVTVVSRSAAKQDDAFTLGATSYVASEEPGALDAWRGTFDLVINTVSSVVDLSELLWATRPLGAVVNLGLPSEEYLVHPYALVFGSRVLAGSNIGGVAATQEMLDFCAAHDIGAEVEVIGAGDVDAAYERVTSGRARYRIVIDAATIPTDGTFIGDAEVDRDT